MPPSRPPVPAIRARFRVVASEVKAVRCRRQATEQISARSPPCRPRPPVPSSDSAQHRTACRRSTATRRGGRPRSQQIPRPTRSRTMCKAPRGTKAVVAVLEQVAGAFGKTLSSADHQLAPRRRPSRGGSLRRSRGFLRKVRCKSTLRRFRRDRLALCPHLRWPRASEARSPPFDALCAPSKGGGHRSYRALLPLVQHPAAPFEARHSSHSGAGFRSSSVEKIVPAVRLHPDISPLMIGSPFRTSGGDEGLVSAAFRRGQRIELGQILPALSLRRRRSPRRFILSMISAGVRPARRAGEPARSPRSREARLLGPSGRRGNCCVRDALVRRGPRSRPACTCGPGLVVNVQATSELARRPGR